MYPADQNDEEEPQYDYDGYYDYYNDYNNYNYSNTAEEDQAQIQWPQGVHFSRW